MILDDIVPRFTTLKEMSYNTTIKVKYGICTDCGSPRGQQPLIGKRCQYHYNLHLRLKSAAKAAARSKPAIDRHAQEKAVKASQEDTLSNWFNSRRKEMTGVCAECGNGSHKHSDVYFRFSVAHILPKKKAYGFPSVATHPLNWVELCMKCHTVFDSNWATASKMKSFAIARERFRQFEDAIAPEERRRIPEIFLAK